MPRGDGTGPQGAGPLTGRRAGRVACAGYDVPGYANPGFGGMGLRRGRHGSGRHMFYATGLPGWARLGYAPAPGKEQETQALRGQAEWLKQQLDAINQRLGALEGES